MRNGDMPCPRCNGKGRIPDPRVFGMAARVLRKSAGLSLREVARRMGFSAPYVCDLEYGRRQWTNCLMNNYKKACGVRVESP